MMRLIRAMDMCVVVEGGPAAQLPKFCVSVTADKHVDFAKFTTYSWTHGKPSADKATDACVMAAVERELGALGMLRAASGGGEVLAAYYSLNRMAADLNANTAASGLRPTCQVGTLAVALLEPRSRRRLLRLRVDQPIGTDRVRLEESINAAVAALFAKYPTHRPVVHRVVRGTASRLDFDRAWMSGTRRSSPACRRDVAHAARLRHR